MMLWGHPVQYVLEIWKMQRGTFFFLDHKHVFELVYVLCCMYVRQESARGRLCAIVSRIEWWCLISGAMALLNQL